MKHYFFLISLCFLFENQVVFSQSTPSVQFSPGVADKLMGESRKHTPGGAPNGVLTCSALLLKTWAYPNAQVTPICNDALYSCVRYGLIVQRLKTATGELLTLLKNDYSLAFNDALMRLRGCQLAIEATLSNQQSLLDAAGYYGSTYGSGRARGKSSQR